ncbi:heavy metal-associated isoprenylated plant protein 3-like isoform X1 [Miscanthus floridulus]|uniref:heavy metal-associated isoprenylated plant protein 3-like isoform X1 n=1 Tax=Miscanthus floridulus TaxID=154761 RepID=UPI00345A151E
MGAGKGGDGGGEAAAAAPEAAQPVVLKMDLHCAGCAHKVKKAIKRVPGVESIVTDVAANRVVVAGTADAGALKARLEAKTSKPVEVVSAGGAPKKPAAAEPKQDAGTGEKKEDKSASAKEKEKKQQAEEKKPRQVGTRQAMPPTQPNNSSDLQQQQQLKNASAFGSPQETVLLKIRLHCDGCADRIRRRIYKIKGVKDVVLEGNAKDEVKVTGTMDIPNMLTYLKEKLNRDVEAVAPPAKKDGGGGEGKDDKKDSGSGGDKNKGAAGAGAGGDDKKDKGKGIDVSAGPSTAAAAAFMAAPAGASTYHVAPPYGYVAYQQAPPPASYYPSYPYYGNGDGMGHANPSYYHQPQQQQPDGSQQPPMAYPPYPYRFDMAPPPQLFSDENPNSCSVM